MDAGLAAVLGALAGSASTAVAAYLTSHAMGEQARLAVRASHVQARSGPRARAYEDFLAAVDEVRDFVEESRTDPDAEFRRPLSDLGELEMAVRHTYIRALLAGPAEITAPATRLDWEVRLALAASYDVRTIYHSSVEAAPTGERRMETDRRFEKVKAELFAAHEGMVLAAQEILAEDGT